jgi:ATP-dependent Lon protease
MPGKLIQSLKKAGSNNPVFLLDEVDKMSTDFRGDPSSALLEVLDPEQNHTFNDHYLDLDYDLSKVMFICTANTMHNIPAPLQDRMEIIRIAGYMEMEKMSIAHRYLIPKQKEANGLADVPVEFTDGAIRTIIHRYTRESGVRSLEREIASIFRKVARDVLKNGKREVRIDRKLVMKYLGVARYRMGMAEREDQIGIVTGLAWTEMGGELLTTEAAVMPGKGKLFITGKLGEVMQESAQAAMSYVRARAERFGIDKKFAETCDIHVHLPEGAIPKDGPSAGVTMATALVSALARIPVRRDVAMTGEITLRGLVLPIGGLKEKALAAHRAGIKTILIPKENRKDLREIPKKIREAMRIVQVEFVDEVLREALILDNPDQFFRKPDPAGEKQPTPEPQPAQAAP